MNRKFSTILSLILIVCGAIMIYIPWSTRRQQDDQMVALKAQFVAVQTHLSEGTADQNGPFFTRSHRVYISLERDYALAQGRDPNAAERAIQLERIAEIKAGWRVDGILNIERIDLSMPIIDNAIMAHLNVSPSSIKDTPKPWQGGNYVIAGHRSTVPGRHFNRLGELVQGDLINFVDRDSRYYYYRVNDIRIVHESELSLLDNTEETLITLITCDPLGVRHPDTRLIVRAKLVNGR